MLVVARLLVVAVMVRLMMIIEVAGMILITVMVGDDSRDRHGSCVSLLSGGGGS